MVRAVTLELLTAWHDGHVAIARQHDQTMDELIEALGDAAFTDPLYLRAKSMSAKYWNAAGELSKEIYKRKKAQSHEDL